MGRNDSKRVHSQPVRRWDTVKTLAQELRVSEKTIRRQIERGVLKAHSIGREIRISPESKDEFLEAVLLAPGQAL